MSLPIDPHIPPVTPPNAPRTAEPSDARLALREHDEQAKRKKEDEKKEKILPEDSYDQTVLGVRALIDFLKNFVHGLDAPLKGPTSGSSMLQQNHDMSELPRRSFHQPPPENPMAARAASAYRHSAAIQTSSSSGGVQGGDIGMNAGTGLIENTEIRQIHNVIALLESLEKRGVPGIRLERAETFVTAIENAARAALSSV